ncbi:shikimate dehydrogenase [Youxingia wuxianensis]|uniref:Shikimate dehydrogenase (NADP(+)) n=1 Tax=Youxingia wuxianensis TaxID=2763678 RepID=A0A926ET82_9FIRM|nr:shikimate dehydrogenase [Youxingia wuxianensis]MBC8585924.1 shikimate dehydrogenase [Youxingia wuxianensis]
MNYAITGYPLGHTMSPPIHNRLFALANLDAEYSVISFPPEEFSQRITQLKALDGFNVTIPYKQTVLPFLDELSDGAKLYGAVNVVKNDGGRYLGYNTDVDGFVRTMQSHRISLATDVCVLGAGGVGRMFAIESVRQGGNVSVAVRESGLAGARELQQEIREKLGAQIAVQDISTLKGPFGLLINATPVGMYPNQDHMPVSEEFLQGIPVVFDCIYNPRHTMLMNKAFARGCRVIGGMDMLVWQAVAAHEIWNGSQYEPAQITELIEDMNRQLCEREKSQ